MKNFILGTIFGAFISALVAWVTAERIVMYKQNAKEIARKNKKPTVGIYDYQGKMLVNPSEANFIPDSETIFQYPRKADLEAIPGVKNEELYDEWFREYIIKRGLTNPEAWKQFGLDHSDQLPRTDQLDRKLQLTKLRKAFYSAMNRRRKALTR